jgi:hypothetical protein
VLADDERNRTVTTKFKLAPKMTAVAQSALEPHVQGLYDAPGSSLLLMMEVTHTERTEVADGEDKDPQVTAKVTSLEVPAAKLDEPVRKMMAGLHAIREARGTLDEHGLGVYDPDKGARDVKEALDNYAVGAAATFSAALIEVATRLESMTYATDTSVQKIHRELGKLADAIKVVLADGGQVAPKGLDLRTASGVVTS